MLVRHLYSDSSLSRHGGNDTYTLSCKAERNVIFKVLYLRNANAWCGSNLVKCYRRTDGGTDRTNLNVEVVKNPDDLILFQL